jgi:carbamoyl-phosphate synthase large subunit
MSNIKIKIVGACIESNSIGFYFCDIAYVSPLASDSNFMAWLIDLCNKEKIDLVLTGVEEIILEIASNIDLFKEKTKSLFISSDYEKLKLGQNKFETVLWLKNNNLNYPEFALANNNKELNHLIEKVGFPLIAKPIKGKGSIGIIKIENKNDLTKIPKNSDYIIQEYIGDENSEYTVACYRTKNDINVNPVIMRRKLKYGTSFEVEIVENDMIKKEALKIANKFKALGPLNIQMRIDKNKNRAVCFELNVRFSGTTPIRAYFGFNDVEALIKEYVLNKDIEDDFKIRKGMAIRYMNEMYIEENTLDIIEKKGYLDKTNNYFILKNY